MPFPLRAGLLLIGLQLTLAACAYGRGGGELGSTGVAQVVTEMPAPTGPGDVSERYAIGPYDTLTIDVFGIEGMEAREVVADSAGRISFPMAGSIDAAGKSPQDVAALIAERLRANYVRNPQVTVNLKEATSQVVTVDGQVQQPGVFPVTGRMTLSGAIASARGLAEFGKEDEVVILRTVEGRKYAGLYNLAAIRRGNYADPRIFANDTVVVGESRSRRIFRDLLQVVPLFTTPIIVALQ